MNDSTTDQLNKRLKSITMKDFSNYLKQLKQAPTLYEFFNLYMLENHLSASEIIRNSFIARNYGYEILNGKKSNPSRDHLLALCIGSHMDLDTTQHALRIAKLGELYSKIPRDAAIMLMINQEQWNIIGINELLVEHELEPIHYTKNLK
ncbi:MAG: hypothetical protein Q4D45_02725 [Lachnospiraceae bacterium]|nr:hypothetical protein [Lachnospiraceae bacterium]